MSQAVAEIERRARCLDPAEREPAQLQSEDDDEKEAEPERRRGEERERRSGDHVVEDRVLAKRGRDADGDRKQQHDHEDRGHQRERVRQTLPDEEQHRLVACEPVAPVAGEEAAQTRDVLDRERAVEPERVLETQAVLLCEVGVALIRGERSARRRLEDRERCDADGKEERQRLQEPAQDVSPHGAAALLSARGYFFSHQSWMFHVNRRHTLPSRPWRPVTRASMLARSYIQMVTYASLSAFITLA